MAAKMECLASSSQKQSLYIYPFPIVNITIHNLD